MIMSRENAQRYAIWLTVVCACFLFCAGASHLSLPSYDDCFYARKGIEMGRRGNFFTVTWCGHATFQNPPLQFWILGRSFALFGENDFAARLPAISMAVAILLMTYRIGRHSVGRWGSLVGVSLLLLTPIFVQNARRCMMEIPLTLWTSAGLLVCLESRQRPKLGVFFAIPLAAAILTKSLLGLLPLLIMVAGIFTSRLRPCWRNIWFLLGILVGLMGGLSWTIHQGVTIGMVAVRDHYFGEIVSRSTEAFDAIAALTGYPGILLGDYQPVILPAIAGLILFFRSARRQEGGDMSFLAVWALLPLALYSVSSARSERYVFPLLPAFSLLAGDFIRKKLPRVVVPLTCIVTPACCLLFGAAYWLKPATLTRDLNGVYKEHVETAHARFAPTTALPYLGGDYWPEANPLAYYWEVYLQKPADSADDAVAMAQQSNHRSLICKEYRMQEVVDLAVPFHVTVQGRNWAWLTFPPE